MEAFNCRNTLLLPTSDRLNVYRPKNISLLLNNCRPSKLFFAIHLFNLEVNLMPPRLLVDYDFLSTSLKYKYFLIKYEYLLLKLKAVLCLSIRVQFSAGHLKTNPYLITSICPRSRIQALAFQKMMRCKVSDVRFQQSPEACSASSVET